MTGAPEREAISVADVDPNDLAMMKELKRLRTTGSSYISPGLFEKLYFSPQNAVKGDLRRTFGNPTPIGLVGFVMGVTPLSCILMGWAGPGGKPEALTAVFMFMTGPLLIISSILEFFLGNTFSFVVFMSYGGFSLAQSETTLPFYNAAAAFSSTGSTTTEGMQSSSFQSSIAFFLVMMGLLNIIFTICSTKTNVAFFIIFLTAGTGFFLLSAAYWSLGAEHLLSAHRLQISSGVFFFITATGGWYVLLAQILASLEFSIQWPLGDRLPSRMNEGDNGSSEV